MWSSRDKYNLQRDIEQLARSYRPITLLVPTESGTAKHDQFTDSALDVTDLTVTVTGQTITWKVYVMFVRLAGPTFTNLTMAGPGHMDMGDLNIFIKIKDLPAFNQVVGDPDGYIYIDGETYKPYGGTDKAGVFRYDELRASCSKVTPRVRATGY